VLSQRDPLCLRDWLQSSATLPACPFGDYQGSRELLGGSSQLPGGLLTAVPTGCQRRSGDRREHGGEPPVRRLLWPGWFSLALLIQPDIRLWRQFITLVVLCQCAAGLRRRQRGIRAESGTDTRPQCSRWQALSTERWLETVFRTSDAPPPGMA